MKGDRQVTEEAAYWLEQMNRPAIDAAIAERFDIWMEASAQHREAFSRLQGLWDAPMDAALSRSEAAPAGDAVAAPAKRGWRSAGVAIGLAAACAAVALGYGPASTTQTYRTANGSGGHFELADGSQIDLSGNAELTVRMLPWSRSAVLRRGEIFMDVRPEHFRRFTVESGPAEIRVLGTAFNIDRQDAQDTVVQVYRGTVAVYSRSGTHRILQKGEAARVTPAGMRAASLPVGGRPEWMSGWFEMSDTPLSVLVEKLNRHAGTPVRIGESALGQRRVSGRFHISQPASVLEALKIAYGVRITRQGNAILLQ